MNSRFIVYPIVLIAALILLILPGFLVNPHRNLRSVTKTAKANPQQTVHQSFSSFLRQFPEGYIITFHTGGDSSFSPTEFVSILRHKDIIVVDIINGVGIENAHRLRGQDALDFLKSHQIDLSALDALVDD